MDAKAEKLALFRYGVIAPLILEALPRGELTRRAQEIAARHYDIPNSNRISVSVDTLLDWALRYRTNGFEALAPKPRQDRGQSRALTPQLASLIERLKRENPSRGALWAGHHPAARIGPVCGPKLSRRVRLHAVPLPQTARSHRAPTAGAARAQEVRSPNQQSDLAGRHAVRTLRPAPRRRQDAGLLARHPGRRQPPHSACPVLSQPGTRCFSRLSAPGHRGPWSAGEALHRQCQDLSLAATGSHRRLARHFDRAYTALSARRPRQNRALLSHF